MDRIESKEAKNNERRTIDEDVGNGFLASHLQQLGLNL
jgi:hypothetical protein